MEILREIIKQSRVTLKKKKKCWETNHQRSAIVVHGWWPAESADIGS